jgi:hypothetical protein
MGKELTEKEAAEYLGLPIRMVRRMAGRGWMKTTRSIGTPEGEKESKHLEFDPSPAVEYFFDEDDLRQHKEENERRKEDMRLQGYDDLMWTKDDVYVASVMASKTDESGSTIYNHELIFFSGGYDSEEEVEKAALESARDEKGMLSEAEGWSNHSATVMKIDMLRTKSAIEDMWLFKRSQFGGY